MARKHKHEEHQNHEAWAIPYGDLVTLLFALFTVMYAMSSVNEGKYRILSDSLVAAFRGAPKTTTPINVGKDASGKGGDAKMTGVAPTTLLKIKDQKPVPPQDRGKGGDIGQQAPQGNTGTLYKMAAQMREAMQSLIDRDMVRVRQTALTLEVEIKTDILFASGVAQVSPAAVPVIDKLAEILKPFPNAVRVEGHTDNAPIRTAAFPSNWELSAGRAANVVQLFTRAGLDPLRLQVLGLGEFHPLQPNDTAAGRNANRRVVIVVMELPGEHVDHNDRRRSEPLPESAAAAPAAADLVVSGGPEVVAVPASPAKTVLAPGSPPRGP